MERFVVGFISLSFCGRPAVRNRMHAVCVFAALSLACAFSAHGQVIDEGGFPVKEGGASHEPFSLSCPSRLYAEAGEAVAISCSAAAVPEEGVRYRWQPVSGGGLHLLSDAESYAPLFTAPVSGESAEYVYRLTATGSGVYAASSVTVTVQREPVLQDECDPLRLPDEPGEGCAEEKGPFPFGFGYEEEGDFLFPEAAGLPDPGGGFDSEAAPRLECPAAVFMEELETGVIECHAWDASGEENLEYSWEPVGSTTRDYLDSPRLIPEDSPTPSVIAPEAPSHETLESFLSGDRVLRYRYRLTATSRATGRSSREEVEIYVSSSRPSVYCPLDVVVEENETVALDCEGVDPLSLRMDYDEEAASVLWEWEGLWGTSTAPLDETHLSSPLFTAPAGSAGEEYHYIASMTTSAAGVPRTARRKVTVRVARGQKTQAAAGAPVVTCNDASVYEGAADFALDCSVTNEPTGATYAWTGTDAANRLSSTTILKPTFDVPGEVGGSDKEYDYTVTLSATGINDVTENVTVTVQEKPDITVTCAGSPYEVDEDDDDIELVCEADGSPAGSAYTWSWSPTTNLTDHDEATSTFAVPDVDKETTYTYTATASADNADDGTATVTVTVSDTPAPTPAPVVTCNDASVYEGAADFALDCSVTNQPTGATYAWTGTDAANRLTDTNSLTPTFSVPGEVGGSDKAYDYTVKLSAGGIEQASEDVTVTVLESTLSVNCSRTYYEVAAGDPDFDFDCKPDPDRGEEVTWVVTSGFGSDFNGEVLRKHIGGLPFRSQSKHFNPTFSVPDAWPDGRGMGVYVYDICIADSPDGRIIASELVTVRVKRAHELKVVCVNPPSVEEGSDDIVLDCEVWGEPEGSTYDYTWTHWGGTSNTDLLSNTTVPKPTFYVPDNVDKDETYEYKLGVRKSNGTGAGTGYAKVTVTDRPNVQVWCGADPAPVYEGSGTLELRCSVWGAGSGGYRSAWTSLKNPQDISLLNPLTLSRARFSVPNNVDETTTYEYRLTVRHIYENIYEKGSDDIKITVLDRGALSVTCADPGSVYEGSEDIEFDCEVSGAPDGSTIDYTWKGITSNTALLSSTAVEDPTFYVPEEVDATTTYKYQLRASAQNGDFGLADVKVTVLNKPRLAVSCVDPPSVYEGSEDIELGCTASGAPAGSSYDYTWTSSTSNTALLSSTSVEDPTFFVPDEVAATTTYEYTLTVTAENATSASESVKVTVLNKPPLAVSCADPGSVYEGSEDIDLDCTASGAPAGSGYTYAWTAQDATHASLLSAADIASPTFYVPDEVAATTTYEYTLTASAENAEDGSARVTVTVLNTGALAVSCTAPGSVYEGSADIELGCTASGAPTGSGYTYAWTAQDAAHTTLLSATDIVSPTFYVPDEVDVDETYEYTLTVSADNTEDGSARVTVTVLNTGALAVSCTAPGSVYEGSEDIKLGCTASGAPTIDYTWTSSTSNTALLSSTSVKDPMFYVPAEVAATTTYEYTLTASAANAESSWAEVTVTVLNKNALAVTCAAPGSVYEGSADIGLDCTASGAPAGSTIDYTWTSSTSNTALLSSTSVEDPTFFVPDEVDATTTYEYTLTASAENTEDGSARVTVTVLNTGALAVTCAAPGSVYEGSEDIELGCEASGAPSGSGYTYVWTSSGDTQDMSLLSATDVASPTFYVPDEVDATTTYKYLLTVSADNAEGGSTEVTVTVLNKPPLALVCADPDPIYEGSEDIEFDCEASGAPAGSGYTYVWTAQDAAHASLLSATDIASPTFYVPDEVAATTTYEYTLTASAENAEGGSAEVKVTVLNKPLLALVCADPSPSVYEGSEDIEFDCEASGAPAGSSYDYTWTSSGDTQDMSLLSAADIASPTFYVSDEVDADETYEYTLTVTADNAMDGSARVTVTVLNKPLLSLVCADHDPIYEGSEDIEFDCEASGAPAGSGYTYVWTAQDAADASLLSATDIASPTFYVPEEVDADETYEYLLTVSAENAEDGSAEITVTVLDRAVAPPAEPVPSPLASSSSARGLSEPSALGVTVSASPLSFGVQSAQTQVSLDPVTDLISTYVSGPYHAGRMTFVPDGSEAFDENPEMDLSIELASPVVLRHEGGTEASLIMLSPIWSYAESCEQLSSQAIGGLYTEVTLREETCRLLLFGGELDLTEAPSGYYAGSLDLVLRSGESEETHSVEVTVMVTPAQGLITIGPGGVRFSTSREVTAGLTEQQNLGIYPDMAFLTEEQPHGVFELSNPSLIPLEVSVSARFGYTEATEDGREVLVENISQSRLGDLSSVVDIHPEVLVLMPGEKGLIRYGMKEEAQRVLTEQGYAAFFDVVSVPRQYVDTDRMPEEITGDRTARVTMSIPGVYVPGEGASQLRARLLSISHVGSLSATFLLQTQDHPFVGEVVAYDGEGRELGRSETLVYTRSRVRIPLARVPEEETVFLRFEPRGSGRVESAPVRWNAPRRDIGDAADEDGRATTATLLRNP